MSASLVFKKTKPLNNLAVKVLFAALIAALFILPSPKAFASAFGCSYGVSPRSPNTYCVSLNGSGTYVNYVYGQFNGGAVICNYYMTAEFFDTSWRWYETRNSVRTSGCANGGGGWIGIYAYKKRGYMCSTLHYYDGLGTKRTMSRCFSIS